MSDPAAALIRRKVAPATAFVLLALALATMIGLGEADRDPSSLDNLPAGYDSTTVTELQAQLPDSGSSAFVLYTRADGRFTQREIGTLDTQYAGLAVTAGSAGQTAPLVPSQDGTALLGVIPVDTSSASETAEVVTALRAEARADLPDGVTAQLTGPAAIQADLAAVFDGANIRLLLTTAAVVALLLLITYRSPWLWLIPLLVVGIADRLAAVLATHTLATFGVAWDESTIGILSVLVFGAGTDYSLLLISRYRDELKATEDRYAAMAHALRNTFEAVLASSTTVILGLLTLLLSTIPATRGLGLACAVGVAVAAFFALVVLPSTLVLFGRWVFWPITPRVGQPRLTESRSLWRWVGDRVSARPAVFAIGTVAMLAILASGVFRIDTGLSPSDQFLATPEAITAAERLGESYPAGSADPAVVLTRSDVEEVGATVEQVSGVQSLRPGPRADGLAQIDVVLSGSPGSDDAATTVRDLRAALASYPQTWVGGTDAAAIDSGEAAAADQRRIIPLILGLVLVALFVLLRSVTAPILLVLTVVATYFASLGLSWLLFTSVLGFEALDVGVPLLAFLFLVALGVDYNIFLVTRAAEEARHHGAREGMLRALTATGGVITSAGILLAAVFAVLGVLPLVVLAQLGVIICLGVLLDTLVVRTVLVPALGLVLGDHFWWPRRVEQARHIDA